MSYKLYIFFASVFGTFGLLQGCGITTHMLISNRARDVFDGKGKSVDYADLINRHNDAFLAGSAFPDAFYSNLCDNGTYHQVSEDTHWTEFLNTSISYIRKTYPQPWTKEAEKLVVFIFGIMSHQVSDVVWHSLGIEHGFIPTLAAVDFHGKYDTAHTTADLGGDVVAIFDMDAFDVLDPEDDWYVPTKDLYNIYYEFYKSAKIDEQTIGSCSTLLVLASIAEIYGLPELYQVVANTSPFLENHMEDYFLGGVNDMVGWTNRIWENGVKLLDNGLSACTLDHNPVFIRCNNMTTTTGSTSRVKNGFYVQPDLHGLTLNDLIIKPKYNGISIGLSEPLKKRKQSLIKKHKPDSVSYESKTGVYAVNSSYAKLGWALATGDMDNDGYDDVVIGAPGYSIKGSPQEGRVYIVYGNNSNSSGFGYFDLNLDLHSRWTPLNITAIKGFDQKQSRFGSGIAVLDINLDGVLDLAVGSPAYWLESPLEYKGLVSVFLGKQNQRSYGHVDLVFTCQSIGCNLGYTLEAGDVDGDGHDDLVMGLPYYTGKYNQSGVVAAFMSSKDVPVGPGKTIAFESLKWKQYPDKEEPYSWFGFKTVSKKQTLAISSPNNRKCVDPNCAYSENDVQEAGRGDIYNYGKMSMIKNQTILGTIEQEAAGYSLDFGYLYDSQTLVLAVGYPGRTVQGSYYTLPLNLTRAGMVVLYNMTTSSPTEVARFEGNRRYGGFGSLVKIMDVNGDGTDDLLVGEPSRNGNKVEIVNDENGLVYVFYGGTMFPKGDATTTSKCSLTKPCAQKVANFVSKGYDYSGVNNGYNAKVLKSKQNEMILFTSDIRYPFSEDVLYSGHRTGGVHHYYVNRK